MFFEKKDKKKPANSIAGTKNIFCLYLKKTFYRAKIIMLMVLQLLMCL